jgi:hypothetical protein
VKTTCPHCRARRTAPEGAADKTIRCPKCDNLYVARAPRKPAARWSLPLVLTGVGGLVLMGAGAAILYVCIIRGARKPDPGLVLDAVRPEKKERTESKALPLPGVPAWKDQPAPMPMRPPAASEPARADPEWTEVGDPKGRYRIRFPGPPKEGWYGKREDGIKYFLGGSRKASFSCYHLPRSHPVLVGFTTDEALLAFKEATFIEVYKNLKARRPITYQSSSGIELVSEKSAGVPVASVSRYLIADGRVLFLSVHGTDVSEDDPVIKEFLESLQLD